ncbi:F0F1 ATP synthase subunit delta [Nakamurella leprariae]|uniref:ATP synthase subunit delta n=1 Tax=Nakamurella leprariae TaxID=2803911 RepID=A0A938Y882_9ACTN|nr:F0F1 ATP synthase subunit delta [Nakamurella leprariae]MBM9465767.1 F0F1 ATP synthase subunit delta [Nakamurella leprariae]
MQHLASRDALAATTRRLLDRTEQLDDQALQQLGTDLRSVSQLLLQQAPLRRTLSENTLSEQARQGIVDRLLAGKVVDDAVQVVRDVVAQQWSSGRDLHEAVSRLGRTAQFRLAERSGELDEVEDQLFRFARIVDANPSLSVVLDDPTADPQARASLVHRLLQGRAAPLVVDLLESLARDPEGRSFSHGVRDLVEQAAERRDKVVAVVRTARPLTDDQLRRLTAALGRIYGREVSLHVEVDAALVGGLRVQVGDEVIDGSIAGRLESLRRSLAGS